MGDYIELSDLAQRVPFKVQLDLADDKNPGEMALTDAQENTLRTAIAADTAPTDTRLLRIWNILTGVITDGEAQVNSYLSYVHSTLPLTGTNVTNIIKAHSMTFAAWYLYGRRQNIPDDIQAMFDNATAWGQRFIPTGDDSTTPIAGTTPDPQFVGTRRSFTESSLKYW